MATKPQQEDCSLSNEFLVAREDAAHRIFSNGSCLVNLEEGFKLAIHQELPDAPRSPFYLNLRPTGVKEGKMEPEDIKAVAKVMTIIGLNADLFDHPIFDIPAAGTPYLDAIFQWLDGSFVFNDRSLPTRIRLKKQVSDGKRSFKLDPKGLPTDEDICQELCMVDDLVASSLTKKLALEPIEQAGGKVTNLLLFLNRSTDAREELGKLGVTVRAAWDFPELMEWALGKAYLTRKQYESIMDYPGQLDRYKRSVGYT